MELYDHSHLWDAHRYEDMFVILSWYLSGASLEPSNQAHIFRHLYVIVLLIPRDVSLTWVWFGLQRSHIWWWMISCHPIFDLPYIWCHTRAYSVSNEIHWSSWSRMIVSIYEIHIETRTCSIFYHDPPVEPFLSHLVRLAFFGIQMSSCFPFWGTPFLSVSLIQLWMWMTRTAHSMMDDLRPFDFFDLSHTWFHTRQYSLFGWDLYISIDLHDHP